MLYELFNNVNFYELFNNVNWFVLDDSEFSQRVVDYIW